MNIKDDLLEALKERSKWVRRETLKIHKSAPETRVASSLSCVEILVVLYYADILRFNPKELDWEGRDRFIVSKGHGAISFYPILADLGYFDSKELERVCKKGSFLGGIPDCIIPGFETTNGSLGHGLGVACGIAMALKRKGRDEKVVVLIGDGELYEGSVWEAVMFAGEHKLDNLIAIIDNNKVCMLDFCQNILDLEPIDEKFKSFKWETERVDGHDIRKVYESFSNFKTGKASAPRVIVADTVKGKGVPSLEGDSLSHIRVMKPEEVDEIVEGLK
jgi:transketolase